MNLQGIDVSEWQGKIDWEAVKSQISFAIIRCGYGLDKPSQDDTYFHRNVQECTRLKIPFGVYLYSHATTTEQAQSEIDHTLRLIKPYKLEYPVFYDVESSGQGALPKDTLVDVVDYYCKGITAAGYYVSIYSSLYWFNTILNSSKLDPYDKWLAQWNDRPTYDKPFGMWQYTSSAKITGISGNVDADRSYKDYPTIIREAKLNHLEDQPIIGLKYKIGDVVLLNGTLYRDSYGAGAGKTINGEQVTITAINNEPNATKPYNVNNGLGWVAENELVPISIEIPKLKYQIGQTVVLNGILYRDSYGTGAGQKITNKEVKITSINTDPKATKPYNVNDGLGWVAEGDLTSISGATLQVGDAVRIVKTGNGSSDGTGKRAWGILWKRIIIAVIPGAKYPYQVGNDSGTTGFYQADALKKL